MALNNGGPALPTVPLNHGYGHEASSAGTGSGPGMSLLQYYAGLAMQALLIRGWVSDKGRAAQPYVEHGNSELPGPVALASDAFDFAVAMVAEEGLLQKFAAEEERELEAEHGRSSKKTRS